MTTLFSFGLKEPRTIQQCTSLVDAEVSSKYNVAYKEVSYQEAQDLYCRNYEIALNTTNSIDTFWPCVRFCIKDAIKDARKYHRKQVLFKDICKLLFSSLPQAGGHHYFVIINI